MPRQRPGRCPSCQSVRWQTGGRVPIRVRGPIQLSYYGDSVTRLHAVLDGLTTAAGLVDLPIYAHPLAARCVVAAVRSHGVRTGRVFGVYAGRVWLRAAADGVRGAGGAAGATGAAPVGEK